MPGQGSGLLQHPWKGRGSSRGRCRREGSCALWTRGQVGRFSSPYSLAWESLCNGRKVVLTTCSQSSLGIPKTKATSREGGRCSAKTLARGGLSKVGGSTWNTLLRGRRLQRDHLRVGGDCSPLDSSGVAPGCM